MFNFDVLVDGRPVKRYYDRSGQIWIEGRKGTAFTLRVKNNSHGRVLGIVSVDGLNVIDAKHVPIEDSRGYIINSYSSINIPGWKISEDEVREFYFTINGHNSYVRKVGADERNIGVIAAAVYREKIYPITSWTYTYSSPNIDDTPAQVFSCSSNMNVNQDSGYISSGVTSPEMKTRAIDNSVSVGSGERMGFKTHSVDFERGVFEGEVIIRYDSWEGLKRRGVLREDEEYRERPQPFGNGNFCPNV